MAHIPPAFTDSPSACVDAELGRLQPGRVAPSVHVHIYRGATRLVAAEPEDISTGKTDIYGINSHAATFSRSIVV